MMGFDYTAGYLLFGLRIHCGQLEVVASDASSGTPFRVRVRPGAQSEMYGNNVIPAPTVQSLSCAGDDQVMTQVESFATHLDGKGPYINELSMTCSQVALVQEDDTYRVGLIPVGHLELVGNYVPDATSVVNDCGDHGVMTQIHLRAGAYIDSTAFGCADLSVEVPAGPSPKAPANLAYDERFMGVVSALALIAVFVLLSNWTRTSGAFLRWLPPLLAGGGGIVGFLLRYLPTGVKISQVHFIGTLSCVGLLVLMTGAVNGRAFRQLSQIEPFRTLAPIALRSSRLRRRAFASYVDQLARSIAPTKREVLQGTYLPLPADLETAEGTRTVNDPHEELGAWLFGDASPTDARADERDAPKLLIEAPGGRGKSTLLNALLLDAIKRFDSGASHRIPVLCTPRNKPWEQLLAEALGPHGLADNILTAQLAAGDFVLFADGLSESDARASELATFIRSNPGSATPMAMACRPGAEFRRAVCGSSNWCLVTPQPLGANSKALRGFVEHYHALDACRLPVEEVLSIVDRICQDSDKKYSPILVRLTIRACASGGAAESIASVYESTFRQLVIGSVAAADAQAEYLRLREVAIRFACESYWQEEEREYSFKGTASDLERLKASGILNAPTVPHRFGEAIGVTVRFFHDSLQSYFAAVGLAEALKKTPASIDDALLWMAGSPRYRKDRSDLFGYEGSELFCMVAHIAARDLLQQTLHKALQSWARTLDGKLARDDVAEALPGRLRGLVAVAPDGMSGGTYLQRVLSEAAQRLSDEMRLTVLEALYARLARIAFDNGAYTKPELELGEQIRFKTTP